METLQASNIESLFDADDSSEDIAAENDEFDVDALASDAEDDSEEQASSIQLSAPLV